MRKIAFALIALGLVATAGSSSAASLVYDTFSYANGNLVPNGGWANYSGAVTDIQVASGRATGGAIGNPANDDHILFAAQAVTAKTYACFDVTIPTPAAGAPKAIFFAELKDGGAANLVSRVFVLPLGGNTWTFGISHSSVSTTVGVTAWPSALSYDVNYHLVINYDPVAKSSTLWVNPAVEGSPSVTNTNTAIAALAVSGFGLRQSNGASNLPPSPNYTGTIDWNWSVDNLGVGATFTDACEIPTPTVPESWGHVKGLYR